MIEVRGKYNTAEVFTDNIDNETVSQLVLLLNQPFIEENKVRIMPDTHAGKGCVIGTTMTLTDKVVPNLVGVDVGCGMYAVQLNESEINLETLDAVINDYVPSGFSVHDIAIAKSNVQEIIAPVDVGNAMKSLGSLGGGNHFIEINRDKSDNLWLVVHTGSRHLGIEVCTYYQNLAWHNIKDLSIHEKINYTIAKLKAEGKDREIENTIKILKMQSLPIPKDLCYVEGQDFENYIHDMKLAQEHAKINRETIVDIIVNKMGWKIVDAMDTIHNYIDTDNMILRKGAISAKNGERVLIPMNMRDGSLICIGKGNDDWNYSAPHGAGRIMSRGQAKERISLDIFKESMNGIYSTSVVESTIDEAPMAYKPMEEIKENIKDTVDVIDTIKPIYNFKAH